MGIRSITCLVLILLIFISSCDDDNITNSPVSGYPDLGLGVEDSLEAFEIALYWDEQLNPNDRTIESQLYHLNYLRQYWIDSLNWLADDRFLAPWEIGQVIVGLDSASTQALLNGNYQGFDQIDSIFVPDSINVNENLLIALFIYDEQYNPLPICEIFSNLPGIRYANPNALGFISGNDFPIIIGEIRGELAYVFHRYYIHSPHYYFRYESGLPIFHGEFSHIDSTFTFGQEILQLYDLMSVKAGLIDGF